MEALGSIAYAFSAVGISLVALYGFLRWVEFKRGQLLSDSRVDQLQRDFYLLDAQTKKAAKELAEKLNDSIVRLESRAEAQEVKFGMNSGMRGFPG